MQVQSAPLELPAGEVEPVQAVHVLAAVAATAAEKVFGGQSWHADASTVSLYVPAAHGVHVVPSNPEPNSQLVTHCSASLEPVVWVVPPSGHGVQSTEPLASLYESTGQASHVPADSAATSEPKVPAVHCLHSLSPATSAKLPGKQASQAGGGAQFVWKQAGILPRFELPTAVNFFKAESGLVLPRASCPA